MTYRVKLLPRAEQELSLIDNLTAQRILTKLAWFSDNVENLTFENLSGGFKGLYKLRIGDYRIIYSVDRKSAIIFVHRIGHRSQIYKRR